MQQEPDSTTNKDATLALIKQKYGIQRSDLWPAVEKAFLANSRKCAVCPSSLKPQVHHIYPFHLCHLVYRGLENTRPFPTWLSVCPRLGMVSPTRVSSTQQHLYTCR